MATPSRSRPGATVYKNIFTGEKVSWLPVAPASKELGCSPDVAANLSPAQRLPATHQSLPPASGGGGGGGGGSSEAMRPLKDLVRTPSPHSRDASAESQQSSGSP